MKSRCSHRKAFSLWLVLSFLSTLLMSGCGGKEVSTHEEEQMVDTVVIDTIPTVADYVYADETKIAQNLSSSERYREAPSSSYEVIYPSTGYRPWTLSSSRSGKNSEIVVETNDSPVLAIIKYRGEMVDHAYISANSSFTFYLKDGTYQTFFYSGSDWSPQKQMPDGRYGGFLKNEIVSKSDPQFLNSQRSTFVLRRVEYGNFEPQSSSLAEAM